MIEFAVSGIVLFALIFGCIVFSMGFYTYSVVNGYARDASRYAMVHGIGCTIPPGGSSCSIGTGSTANTALKTFLNQEIFPGINGNNLAVTTTYAHGPGAASCNANACNGAGDQVTVNVSYPYLYAVPFVPSSSFTMRATSTMVISQ